jgi:hypothetical protein
MVRNYPAAELLASLLNEGSGVKRSPADERGELFDVLSEVDLLEAHLTGAISSSDISPRGQLLVQEQFGNVEDAIGRAPGSKELELLESYVRRLKGAYGDLRRRE